MTDRRQSERKVRESELKFRTLANSISQLAWMARPDGYISWYNDRWLDYTGLTLEKMLERGWEAILDPAEAGRVTDKIRLHFASGEPWEDTFPLRGRDGAYRWFLSRMLPVRDEGGSIRLWFGTNTDIEELRLTERERQKFVSLVESSTDFVATFDLDGKPLYVNRAGMDMIGLENMDEARSIGFDDLILAEDRERLRGEFLPAALRDGHAEIEVRVRHRKTGELLWVNCHLFANKDEAGKTTAYSTVSREITERKRLETNLRQVASDLSEANRRQFQFLATLAHELRNPLAPILTGLELIRKSVEHPLVVEEARGMMERQTRHMVRLIDDLLDLSRITQGKLNLRRSRVELGPIVRDAVESIQPFIDNARHRLDVRMPAQPLFLNADPNRLAQVIANVLSNAAKYTPNGGRIALAVEAEGPEAVIRVKDNGIGIPRDMQHRVFEMFVQIERSNESGYTGLGIGLTLVRQIVQMHGGSIEVASEGENRGTEFTVRMPLLLEAAPFAEPTPPVETATEAPVRRILVVDDNRDAAETMSLILQLLGNDVRLAYDGWEAVQKAEQFRPKVVLMDIGMPRLNGYEAARRIREQPWGQEMTLVALTGWGQEEDKEKTRTAGFDYHLTKPAEPDVIRELLAKLR
jgi:PAS domain S-box-containing protein